MTSFAHVVRTEFSPPGDNLQDGITLTLHCGWLVLQIPILLDQASLNISAEAVKVSWNFFNHKSTGSQISITVAF